MGSAHLGQDVVRDPLVERAIRLFEFLGRGQQLKNQPPRTVERYQREGRVLWLEKLPHHPAVKSAHRGGDPGAEDAVLTIDRVPRLHPPVPDEPLDGWLNGPLDDPSQPPGLRDSITVTDEEAGADTEDRDSATPSRQLRIDERPDVAELFGQWSQRWRAWAEQEKVERPVRATYGELFSTYVATAGNPEDFELVLGVGCLAWNPPEHLLVKRHLLTAPVVIRFDDDTGRLAVELAESADGLTTELDMLDPGLTGSQHLHDVRAQARRFDEHPLHRDGAGSLLRRLVHILDAEGEYRDQDDAPVPASDAVVAFAPAVIMRRRTQQGLIEVFHTIVEQLTGANEVPDGVLPLIDPDHQPQSTNQRVDGALVRVDEEPFLPLPVNATQLRIIQQVDHKAQTLVQGPPGTGKTHTAAALLSHLLAQGKRVLVTAHTDRALKEVRDKLPAAIKPLSVAIVGSSREEMSGLKVNAEKISVAAGRDRCCPTA